MDNYTTCKMLSEILIKAYRQSPKIFWEVVQGIEEAENMTIEDVDTISENIDMILAVIG